MSNYDVISVWWWDFCLTENAATCRTLETRRCIQEDYLQLIISSSHAIVTILLRKSYCWKGYSSHAIVKNQWARQNRWHFKDNALWRRQHSYNNACSPFSYGTFLPMLESIYYIQYFPSLAHWRWIDVKWPWKRFMSLHSNYCKKIQKQ